MVAQDQRVNFDKITYGANSNIDSTTYKIGRRFLTLILTVVGPEQIKALFLGSRLASNGGVHLVPVDDGWSHQPVPMRDLESRLVAIEVC